MSDEQNAQRRLGRDLRELTADAFAGLAQRFGWKPPVEYVPLGYETIGEAEFGYAVSPSGVTIEDETSLAGGQLEKAYEHHLFTNTCVNYIATRMAGVPLRFYRSTIVDNETQLEPADDHPVAKAFNFFNPHQSNYEAWEWLHSWTLIAGQGPMLKEPRSSTTPDGIPFELYPLYPNGLRPIRSTTKGLLGYRYALNGKETFLLPEDVVVFREFSTDVRFSAMGRLFAGRKEITTDLRAREWNDRMIKQGVHISGTLETEQDMSADKAATVREVFERKYAGSSQAHRIMVLHSGLKFNPTTFAHTDIGFIDQLKLTKEDIALAFGIPEELLGAKSANFAALREKRRVFWEDTIKARTRRIEAVMNSSVLPMLAPELVAYYDFSDVEALRQDQAQLVKTAKEAVASGTMTINEARIKVLELDEIEGGDALFIARGLQPLEAALAEAVELPPDTTADDGAGDRDSSRAAVSGRGSVAHALASIRGDHEAAIFKAEDPYQQTIRKMSSMASTANLRRRLHNSRATSLPLKS
jgi:HK97 family phage portal protein